MKRLSFAIMLALCTMGVWAQEGIMVEFEGANPNIFDFAWSYLIIVDKKAGFISYEHLHQGHAQLIELCFWNEADKKHKLFAYSNWSYFNGHPELGQFDALAFYRYDNATRTMEYALTPGFDVIYENGTTYSRRDLREWHYLFTPPRGQGYQGEQVGRGHEKPDHLEMERSRIR